MFGAVDELAQAKVLEARFEPSSTGMPSRTTKVTTAGAIAT